MPFFPVPGKSVARPPVDYEDYLFLLPAISVGNVGQVGMYACMYIYTCL